MAKRLTTRLSAGAALVTGLGMVGIATAVPAQAVTVEQSYDCTYTVLGLGPQEGDNDVDVTFDVTLPETATVGEQIDPDVAATVTIPESRRRALYDLLQVRAIDGPNAEEAAADPSNGQDARNEADFTLTDGTDTLEGSIPLEIPSTPVPDAGDLVVTATGGVDPVTAEQEGTFTFNAGDFQGYIRGYNADGDYVTNVTLDCTNVSEDTTVGTVEVGPADEEPPTDPPTDPGPEVDDWFDEPSSLPLVDNVFTVAGTASRGGTLSIQVLAGTRDEKGEPAPGEPLETYEWEVDEGDNEGEFDLVEGGDYVRILSQDCVDADGNTEEVAGGCNVTYAAPWAEDGGDSDGDMAADDGAGDDTGAGGDAGTDEPEVPAVVQTDGFTPAAQHEDDTAALALGGLLFAGVGAGAIVVARRRVAQH